MNQRWHYHIAPMSASDERALAAFGADGWELVAVVPLEMQRVRCYFKRPAPMERIPWKGFAAEMTEDASATR